MSSHQFTDDHRILFIDQQASFDLAAGCLRDGHSWEALRDALDRAQAFLLVPAPLPPASYGGLSLR